MLGQKHRLSREPLIYLGFNRPEKVMIFILITKLFFELDDNFVNFALENNFELIIIYDDEGFIERSCNCAYRCVVRVLL